MSAKRATPKRARRPAVRRMLGINAPIVAAIVVFAAAQYSALSGAPLTDSPDRIYTPAPTLALPDDAASPAAPPAVSSSSRSLPTPTALATPPATPPATPGATSTPTAYTTPTPTASTPTASASPTAPTFASATPTLSPSWPVTRVLGTSTLGWPIEAYQFGNGPVRLAFIGGIHGGYEWNTILLAYEAIDHYAAHLDQIPASISLTILPAANPDGQVRVLGHAGRFTAAEVPTNTVAGRFNGNDVDLNRNWNQNWAAVGVWGRQEVSTGDAPFSEVETQTLRDYLPGMDAVVFWHSASPGVYVASCDDVYPASGELAAVYAGAADYPVYEEFYDYAVTGNATDWLACAGVPAIAVELTNHSDTDGAQNLAGIQAVIDAHSGPTRPPAPVLQREPVNPDVVR